MTSPRHVLVTGASRGIGRATAQAFAANGDHVAVHVGRAVEDGAVTLASLSGTGHVLVQADIGDREGAGQLVARAEDALGAPVTVLVNNAGLATTPESAHSPTVDALLWAAAWDRYLRVNTLGTAVVTHAMTSRLIELGLPGHVVGVGSGAAHSGATEFPAYAASKAAVHAMHASLAAALAPHGITVATVAPGIIGTERFTERLAGPDGERMRSASPFGRVGTPEEVAFAILWLASPAASWAAGATLDLNGASRGRP